MASTNSVGRTYQPRSAGGSSPPEHDAGALLPTGPDVFLDLALVPLSEKGSDVGGLVGGVSDLQARHHLGQRSDDLVVAPVADQDAGLRDTGLPVVHQAGRLQPGHGLGDVGIVENDRRGFAAQFQAHPFELLSAERT